MEIGKFLYRDRNDFAFQQGGAKGAVPKGTALWGRTPLGGQSTLLPSNEALSVSRYLPISTLGHEPKSEQKSND